VPRRSFLARNFRFRSRLLVILALFAFVPSILLTLAWSGIAARMLPVLTGTGAWENVARSGDEAIRLARSAPQSPEARAALARHERELGESRLQARRYRYLMERAVPVVAILGLLMLGALSLLASRAAGHLSRQLSRPLDELVGWTERIARGEPLPRPAEGEAKGAPEFADLRERMRQMEVELEAGRRATIESERLAAFRESARQVAHELKNPLTPIRFAVASLRRQVGPELAGTIDVLDAESARLEAMAKSFAQFGRLPEGPTAQVDLADLARETMRVTLPEGVRASLDAEPAPLVVLGQHDALHRALSNVLLNAVHATEGRGRIAVRIARAGNEVTIAVRDDGVGIAPDQLERIWEPYVTAKTGGTGLGLAIVKQTVRAHQGRVEAVSATSGDARGTEIRLHFPADITDHGTKEPA
jgi:nitrogen fixation/metabolism regulation signal transduction histidine kinase